MSDGILRVLAIATLLYVDNPPSVVMFEEPENGIHPQLLRVVVQMLRELTLRKLVPSPQVIFTTHSPYVLDEFYEKPKEVFLMDRAERGSAVFELRTSDELPLVKELFSKSLGEAWFSGLIRTPTASEYEVRRLIAGTHLFVIGIAIEEIEAWWLADRRNTLAWTGLQGEPPGQLEYLRQGYSPEGDQDPKRTLDELTNASPLLELRYGRGNAGLAFEFADRYWSDGADLGAIEIGCPHGFAPFCNEATERLSREKRRLSRKS
jgi:hypothetical protein